MEASVPTSNTVIYSALAMLANALASCCNAVASL